MTTRWLGPDEQLAWRHYLLGVARLADRLDTVLKDAAGMTMDDYEILVHLSEAADDRLKMSELADRLLFSKSRVSYRVTHLVERGWIERISCPSDGRVVWAQLTPAGRRVLEAAAPVHVASVRELFVDHFDRDAFLALGDTMAEVAGGERLDCHAGTCGAAGRAGTAGSADEAPC